MARKKSAVAQWRSKGRPWGPRAQGSTSLTKN